MATKLTSADMPSWPRLLSRTLAAAYIGLSTGSLDRIPVPPVRIGSRVLYDRNSLDAYVDTLSTGGLADTAGDDWLARLE